MAGALASSRLARLAQRPQAPATAAAEEHCEMCSQTIAPEHRHVLDLADRELRCVCKACSLLFDHGAAGGGNLRLVPDRRLTLDLEMGDELWEELRLPVDMAFFFHSTPAERVQAFYPSPMGPTESELVLEAWAGLESANPVLATLAPDVEALLVNRARGARQAWVVPIDECYGLVGLIRTRWRGLTGGREVWEEISRFFEALDRRSRRVGPNAASSDAAERR